MKYQFQVKIYKTYSDEDIEVEIPLSDEEAHRIKKLVANFENTKEQPADEEDYVPETSLLQILEDGAPDLFDKFWTVIYKPVFVELLIDGMNNYSSDLQHDDDPVDDPEKYRIMPFDKLYDMYGDDIDLEHSSCCICRIPEEWKYFLDFS